MSEAESQVNSRWYDNIALVCKEVINALTNFTVISVFAVIMLEAEKYKILIKGKEDFFFNSIIVMMVIWVIIVSISFLHGIFRIRCNGAAGIVFKTIGGIYIFAFCFMVGQSGLYILIKKARANNQINIYQCDFSKLLGDNYSEDTIQQMIELNNVMHDKMQQKKIDEQLNKLNASLKKDDYIVTCKPKEVSSEN